LSVQSIRGLEFIRFYLLCLLTVFYFCLLFNLFFNFYLIFKLNLNFHFLFIFIECNNADILSLSVIEPTVFELIVPTSDIFDSDSDYEIYIYDASHYGAYEGATYGRSESDGMDSESNKSLADSDSHMGTLADSPDSDYSETDSGYEADSESETEPVPSAAQETTVTASSSTNS